MQTLEILNTKRLYVKYFDVKWNETTQSALPVAKISFEDSLTNFEIVPVVFITNEALLKTTRIENLTINISQLIVKINEVNCLKVNQIQIDCDWTEATKDKYFLLLKLLKKQFQNCQLSCTIRLHQIKYFERTGLPPVDVGVLMYYNMGQLGNLSKNSIYNPDDAQKYVRSIPQYPLPLDVALPIFSWAVHFQNNKIQHLISKPNVADFENSAYFYPAQNNVIKVKQSLFLNGYYLKENDVIKLEIMTPKLCKMAAKQVAKYMKKVPKNIIFYDLDSTNFNHFDHAAFSQIIRCFE